MLTGVTSSVPPTSPAQAGGSDLPRNGGDAASAPAPAAAAPAPPPPPPPAATESSLKLVVARAATSMAYTYTLVDQLTGRVVAEIPHQAAQDAAASPTYAAGGMVDTTA
jgi:hypothetical protein